MDGVAIGHNFERGPSKDHFSKAWSKLAQWFLRRRLKCEKLTTEGEDIKRQNHLTFLVEFLIGHLQLYVFEQCLLRFAPPKTWIPGDFIHLVDISSKGLYVHFK